MNCQPLPSQSKTKDSPWEECSKNIMTSLFPLKNKPLSIYLVYFPYPSSEFNQLSKKLIEAKSYPNELGKYILPAPHFQHLIIISLLWPIYAYTCVTSEQTRVFHKKCDWHSAWLRYCTYSVMSPLAIQDILGKKRISNI